MRKYLLLDLPELLNLVQKLHHDLRITENFLIVKLLDLTPFVIILF